MKLLELLRTRDSNLLFEQAFKRKDIESCITSLANPITKHLIKILKWEDPINYNKHVGDIHEWLLDIKLLKLKIKNKPKPIHYFKWLFTDYAGTQEIMSQVIFSMHRYNQLPVIRTDEEVYDIIKNILWEISKDIPQGNYTTLTNYLPK